MSRAEAVVLAAAGLALLVAGVVWLAGPWGLAGCGLLLTLTALLAPVRERREPADDDPAP